MTAATPSVVFERRDQWLFAHGTGEVKLPWLAALFAELARRAAEEPTVAILVDLKAMTANFTTADRYEIGKAAAAVFFGAPAALIGSAGMVDPERLGELVARNRGVDGRVFTDRDEAVRWLESRVAARRAQAPLD